MAVVEVEQYFVDAVLVHLHLLYSCNHHISMPQRAAASQAPTATMAESCEFVTSQLSRQ